MRLAGKARRSIVLLLMSLMLAGVLTPIEVFGQSQELKPPQALTPPQTLAPPDNAKSIIDRAEEAFRRGEEAQAKGLPDIARKMFDQAVDSIHQSGIDLKTNPKLETYYRQLLNRIHKHEAPPDDIHPAEEQQEVKEVAEPALLDELSDIKETEL